MVQMATSEHSPTAFDVKSFSNVSILSASTGESVLVNDLLDKDKGITVVALLRHFGCICSWELATLLRDAKPKFDSAGVRLVAVGIGSPKNASVLAKRLPFPLECLYVDPGRKVYGALGLYHGVGRTFFNKTFMKVFLRAKTYQKLYKNYTITATPDIKSVFQQGGMFVFKGKQLLYARKDEATGDHAPMDDILNVCCQSPVS